MNLVIPIGSASKFFPLEDYFYPKPLVEILGKPMIQHVIENLTTGTKFDNIIFIVRQEDCDKYHLDNTLNLISPTKPTIIRLRGDTQGALCSVLLAIEHIDNGTPLVISNADQVFTTGIAPLMKKFTASDFDAACATFDSVHPRWSYVRTDKAGQVVETAEKRPISQHAIAGLYFYKHGADFVANGMNAIRHGASTDGAYFIAPVFNEFILAGKKVGHFPVPNDTYHTFYNPQKVKEYEAAARSAA